MTRRDLRDKVEAGRRFAARLSVLVGVVFGCYTLVLRPRMLHSGATPDEQTRPLPGDDLVPRPTYTTTRAITIRAPAHEIWPPGRAQRGR